MPGRRRRTAKRGAPRPRKAGRRMYKKRQYRRTGIPQNLGLIVPEKSVATLKYAAVFSNAGSTNSYYSWTAKSNSIYDPDESGVGHQPMGFDQLTMMYSNYSVLSSTMIVHVTALQGSQNIYAILIRETTNTGYSFNIETIAEQNPTDRIKIIAPQRSATLKKTWSCKLIDDKGENTGATGNFGTGTDPNMPHYFRIHTQSTNGASLVQQPQFAVEIYYKTLFTNRKLLAPS